MDLDSGSNESVKNALGAAKRGPDVASVTTTLRKLIGEGRYAAGERLAEIPVAQALGVSRTPVRMSFRTLAQEGLLQSAGKRGYVVRKFSERDVHTAVEVRGVLEGLAARLLAERGISDTVRETLRRCVKDGARLLQPALAEAANIGAWSQVNSLFHRTIVASIDSTVIADAIARNDHLPFASAESLVIDPQALDREYQKLRFAQLQHQLVLEAIENRESARAESLMREHSYVGFRYGKLFAPVST